MAGHNYNPCTCILFCLLAFNSYIECRPTDNTIDSIFKGTAEAFSKIYDPLANHTKNLVDYVSNGISNDKTINSMANQTAEIISNIYDPLANQTKHFVVNILTSENINETTWEDNQLPIVNCTIVIGGAMAGAVVGIIAIAVVVPLALCLLGFTCWGIMAGSAAACCQSRIGDVPSGSCFSCTQSLGAGGGGRTYLVIACVIGIPLGMYVGGMYTETYNHCFTSK